MTIQGTRHGQNEKARHAMRRAGYKVGGAIPSPGPALISTPVEAPSPPALPKRKYGGSVMGGYAPSRLDRFSRGEKHNSKKPAVTVNIVNAPQAPAEPAPPPMPVGPRPMPMPPPGAMPPPGMGAPGPGPGPGGPPMGLKTGGKVKKLAEGGEPTQGYSTKKIPEQTEEKHLARGGRTFGGKAAPHMTSGAGNGEGRLEKIDEYGKKPKAK